MACINLLWLLPVQDYVLVWLREPARQHATFIKSTASIYVHLHGGSRVIPSDLNTKTLMTMTVSLSLQLTPLSLNYTRFSGTILSVLKAAQGGGS